MANDYQDNAAGRLFSQIDVFANEHHMWPYQMPKRHQQYWYAQAHFNRFGVHKDEIGELHGQPCYLRIYTPEKAKLAVADLYQITHSSMEGGDFEDIDGLIKGVLEDCVQFQGGLDATEEELHSYDGLRAGAGWILGCLYVAKSYGCDQASVGVHSNDGNLSMSAWKVGTPDVFIYAYHDTYYGS